MLQYHLIFIFVTVAVLGEENELSDNYELSLDVLIPKKDLLENSRSSAYYKNNQANQGTEGQDSSCLRRSKIDEDHPAINSLDEPPPPTDYEPFSTQDQNYELTSSEKPKTEQSYAEHQEVRYPENHDMDKSASEDHEREEPNALDLRLAWPNNDPSRRSDNSPIDPSELAAEIQDCLQNKLRQKKPNVVVVMPVLDKKQPVEDINDKNYLITFVEPQGKLDLLEIHEDTHHSSNQDNNYNKKLNKEERDKYIEKGTEINKDNNVEKEPKITKNIQTKLENKVQKFLRTGIAEDTLESDQNLENLDGRRRNNYYDRLPLTEVVDSIDSQKTTGDQSSVAGEPVFTEQGSENNRAGMTDRRVCYACSTLNNPSCENPNRMTTVKYCAGSRNACSKKTYETGGTAVLVRDCAATCNDNVLPAGIVPEYKTCDLCHNDLCNGAYSLKDQSFLILFLLSSWALCKIIA